MKTYYRKQKMAYERAVYRLYRKLTSLPGAMPTACEAVVMKRFNIKSRSTVYDICKRVANQNGDGKSI